MNITQFAKIAGVSKSAVSRYFNNGYLSEEKREQIKKAVIETGYTPSTSAQSIRTRITKLVGVILPKLSSESTARVVEGIGSILEEHGYELLLVNTANDHKKELKYLDLFRQNRVDGVIFLASVFTPVHRTLLHKMRVPVIVVGQDYKGCSCVCHDDFGAAYTVTRHLLEKKCRYPAYVGAMEQDHAVGGQRKKGFFQAVEEQKLTVAERHIRIAEFSFDSGYEQAKRLWKEQPYPDAIFCATDTIAAGVMLYCREREIKIPEQVRIGSVGDSKTGQVLGLTTVHLHYKTAGIEAAKMLLESIYHKEFVPQTKRLGYQLIERKTT